MSSGSSEFRSLAQMETMQDPNRSASGGCRDFRECGLIRRSRKLEACSCTPLDFERRSHCREDHTGEESNGRTGIKLTPERTSPEDGPSKRNPTLNLSVQTSIALSHAKETWKDQFPLAAARREYYGPPFACVCAKWPWPKTCDMRSTTSH